MTVQTSAHVSIDAAAKHFHRSLSQIRRWIAEGAPSYRESNRTLVDLCEIEQWYARRHNLPSVETRPAVELYEQLAQFLWDTLKRDSSGLGMPIHEVLGISEGKAAGFLVLLHRYLFLRRFEREPFERELPEPILKLFAIARMHAHGDTVLKN